MIAAGLLGIAIGVVAVIISSLLWGLVSALLRPPRFPPWFWAPTFAVSERAAPVAYTELKAASDVVLFDVDPKALEFAITAMARASTAAAPLLWEGDQA